jgi:hypothetical protein
VISRATSRLQRRVFCIRYKARFSESCVSVCQNRQREKDVMYKEPALGSLAVTIRSPDPI